MRDWKSVRLDDVADIRISNVDKKSVASERPVRLCNYMDVYGNDYIDGRLAFMEATASQAEIERFKIQCGDVLITKDSETPDDIGIPAVVMEDVQGLVAGYHLALIRSRRDRVDPVYLAKQLSAERAVSHFSRRAAGSTRYGLSTSTIASTPILVAPLPVQRRIAKILSTLDSAIEQTKALVAKQRLVKSGLVLDLFQRGVSSNGNMRDPFQKMPEGYRHSKYGWIPVSWVDGRLSEFLAIKPKNGYSPPEVVRGSECKALGLSCLTRDGFRPLHLKSVAGNRIAIEAATLRAGDLLISRSNTPDLVGLCGMYEDIGEKCIHPDLMMKLCPTKLVLPEFMEAVLQSPSVRRQIKVVAVGTSGSMVKLNGKTVSDLHIVVPPIDEQERIVGRIKAEDRLISQTQAELEKLLYLKKGVSDDLLRGRLSNNIGCI